MDPTPVVLGSVCWEPGRVLMLCRVLTGDKTMPLFQTVSQQRYVDRKLHVWSPRPNGEFICVLCGGVTRTPTLSDPPERVEPLTDQERVLCPRRGY